LEAKIIRFVKAGEKPAANSFAAGFLWLINSGTEIKFKGIDKKNEKY
jgi:hypothetical protein